jgi:hypothetical protein
LAARHHDEEKQQGRMPVHASHTPKDVRPFPAFAGSTVVAPVLAGGERSPQPSVRASGGSRRRLSPTYSASSAFKIWRSWRRSEGRSASRAQARSALESDAVTSSDGSCRGATSEVLATLLQSDRTKLHPGASSPSETTGKCRKTAPDCTSPHPASPPVAFSSPVHPAKTTEESRPPE